MSRSGYTLKELIVVLTVGSILACLFNSVIMSVDERSRYAKTLGLMKLLQQGSERYKNEDPSGAYPGPGGDGGAASITVLVQKLCLPRPPMATSYLSWRGTTFLDAWGRPLRYWAPEGDDICFIRSAGENGRFDDDDDIDSTQDFEPLLAP